MHLAVQLDGAGHHPAAWRDPAARPRDLFDADYWVSQVQTAERGLLDFVSLEDAFGMQSLSMRKLDGRTDQVRGRLEAMLLACRIAPQTSHIGLIPVATTTYPEPFHHASAISTLDYVSGGRAGWQPRISSRESDADLVGTKAAPRVEEGIEEVFEEARDSVEVVRRLWDSWEDDAMIRDVTTGRFIDRDRLHYIDFEGRFFSVRGPSIVPRPPQGQPIVAVLAHQPIPWEFAATSGDIVFITPADTDDVPAWVANVRAKEAQVNRQGEPLRVMADIVVFLGATTAEAEQRKQHLDELAGFPMRSDAAIIAGDVTQLADTLEAWRAHGLDGFRLRPGVVPTDLDAIVDGLVPELQRRGIFRTEYESGTLRDRFGLERPASRYVGVRTAGAAGEERSA